eukprot:TRINITY_DN35527_c0_g1_i1.p1 TRINITY_DN35527_c0_g1~~TRINITY_DN35527_c0_g1_i1.p1  ORF type:complete len:761 (-),score=216.23 TRINITY_DN35527_c0_g1_i1:66-2348(-)
MHFSQLQQRLEPGTPWTPERSWEAALHATPQSMPNLDAFATADFQAAREQFTNWSSPMHVPQPVQPPAVAESNEQQDEQQQRMAQMVRFLQSSIAQQGLPPDGEFFQQTLAEIAKRMPGFDATSSWAAARAVDAGGGVEPGANTWNSWVGTAAALQAQGLIPGAGSDELGLGGLGREGAEAASGKALDTVPKHVDPPADKDQRVEELNRYIRQQAHEYIEGQAEWSRQIAEVRSESLREVEKVRREKEEVERQARHELLRLKHRIRELGGGDEAFSLNAVRRGPDAENKPVAPWAAVVGMDEHQELLNRCTAAEDRVRELEQYIKVSKASGPGASGAESDEQALQQTIGTLGRELQQVAGELHALHFHHQHKVLFWEQGARRLLAVTQQFFDQNNMRGLPLAGASSNGSGDEEDEGGRFGKTATKVHVTLSPSGDKGNNDVGSLIHNLKDALRNGSKSSSKRCSPSSKEAHLAGDSIPSSLGSSREASPSGRSVGGTVCQVTSSSLKQVASSASLKLQSGAAGANECAATSGGEEAPAMAETARVAHFMAQLATDLRQLLTLSQQAAAPACTALPAAQATSAGGEADTAATPPAAGAVNGGAQSPAIPAYSALGPLLELATQERGERLRRIVEAFGPARRGAAQHIVGAERALRVLDRGVRSHCKELFGCEELAEGMNASEVEAEARGKLRLAEEQQLQCLTGIRQAQRDSSLALAEFVQLPQKLKVVFDLTKQLSAEVEAHLGNTLVSPEAAQAKTCSG